MLEKNKKSALILSIITVLAYSLTGAILTMLIPYLITGDIHTIVENPEILNDPVAVVSLAIILLVALLGLIGIGAYWLYRFFGEAYYGKRGTIRWVLFGITFAVFMWLPSLLPNLNWMIKMLLNFLGLFAAFALTRKLVPLSKSSKA